MIDNPVRENMTTPWGAAQAVSLVADGIGMVHTAGHGGFKLSDWRNSCVPAYMRRRGGWYEEDCEVAIPLCVFAEELKREGADWLKQALTNHPPAETLANWYPEYFEKFYGRKPTAAESFKVREQEKAAR
jgi:hypothetical protein